MKKQVSFSNLKLNELRQIVSLKPQINNRIFDKWFLYAYELNKQDELFLEALINDNQVRMPYFSEEELKMKFIAPLLNRVDFTFDEVTDWYERSISSELNGVEIGGVTDYLVAKGIDEPELPYFFIQEFKPSRKGSDPEVQLLAELLVAMELNHSEEMVGTTIVGKIWDFILVKKISDNNYTYYKSSGFNTLNIEDFKKLFIALQGVKADIISKIEN